MEVRNRTKAFNFIESNKIVQKINKYYSVNKLILYRSAFDSNKVYERIY